MKGLIAFFCILTSLWCVGAENNDGEFCGVKGGDRREGTFWSSNNDISAYADKDWEFVVSSAVISGDHNKKFISNESTSYVNTSTKQGESFHFVSFTLAVNGGISPKAGDRGGKGQEEYTYHFTAVR